MSAASLRILGAADTVTGSRYLIADGAASVLVDCGLFQGYKSLRERNRAPFPVPPAELDAVVITHAHLDHSGYLPALVRDGFRGPVFVTEGTADLLALLLPDSARLLEEEATAHRSARSSRHAEPRPLYTEADAMMALDLLRPVRFRAPFEIAGAITGELVPAGHIVGAAQARIRVGATMLHFTGDLGRPHDPIMLAPEPLGPAELLVTESTYGDRHHPAQDPEADLAEVVNRVAARGGVIVIPAFAVGRAEALVFHLSRLRAAGRIPPVPVYLNSPMAVQASEIYREHAAELRLAAADIEMMDHAVRLIRTVDESKRLNEQDGPMIIISASGMLTGGRVLHHLVRFGPDPRNAIVLSGFQAPGTRGARLADGERTVRVFGRDVPIGAEVVQLASLSAHADSDEVLAWMRAFKGAPPRLVLITHGEPHAADTLRTRIARELGWPARVPSPLDVIELP